MKRKALLLTLLMALAVPLAVKAQAPAPVIPYSENFQSYLPAVGISPDNWTVTNRGYTSYAIDADDGYNDSRCFSMTHVATGSGNVSWVLAVLPDFNSQVPAQFLKITFHAKCSSTTTDKVHLRVGYVSGGQFTSKREILPNTLIGTTINLSLNGNGIIPDDAQFAFMFTVDAGADVGTSWFVDNIDVFIDEKVPYSVTASYVSGTTADLNWNVTGNYAGFEVQYDTDDQFTSPTTMTVNTTSASLTGLISATSYYARVRTKYTNTKFSAWSATCNFATGCDTPTDINVTTEPSVTMVNWNGNAPLYNLEYQSLESIFNYYNGFVVSSNNYYSLDATESTPLVDGMRYKLRVQAQCSPESASEWSDWVEFQTACPNYLDLPLHANFDYMPVSTTNTANNLPGCWTYVNTSTDPTYSNYPLLENNQSLCYSNYYPSGQYNYVRFNIPANGEAQYLVFPRIDPVSSNGITVSFWYRSVSSETLSNFVVGLMPSFNTNEFYTKSGYNGGGSSTTYYQASFTFTAEELTQHGNYLVIKAPSDNTQSVSFCIDDIDIYPEGYICYIPASVHTTNVTMTTAEIAWMRGGTETQWGLQYKKSTDNEWTTVYDPGISSTSWPLTDLEPNTSYNVRVRSWCNAVDYSEWNEELTFTTLGVTPVPTNLAVDEDNSGSSWVTITWDCTPVTGQNAVSKYHIEISEDGQNWHGGDWTPYTMWGTVNQSLTINSIDRGQHYFHVQVVDDQNNEGAWSEPQPFTIEGCNTVTNIRTEDPTETYTFTSAYLPECWTITGDRPDRVTTSENALGFDAKGGNVVATCVELEQICVSEAFSGLTVSFDWRHLVQDMNNTTQVTVQLQYCLGLENENWQDAGEPISLFEEMGEPYWSVDPYTRIIPYDYWTRLRFMFTVTDYQAFNYGLSPKCAITNLTLTGRDVCSNPPGWHVGAPVTYNGGRVFWGKVDAALGYDIRYRADTETEWTTIEGVEGIETENNYLYYDLTGLLPNTDYRVQVKSECSPEWPDLSVYASFKTEDYCVFTDASGDGYWDNAQNWAGGIPTIQDDVVLEADVTIPSSYVAKANSIDNNGHAITIEDVGELQCNNQFSAIMKKTILPYPPTPHVQGYYLIAAPMKGNQIGYNNNAGYRVWNLLTTDIDSGNPTYDFYKWDYHQEQEWRNYRAANFPMENGKGYLYANQNGTELIFEGTMLANDVAATANAFYSNENYEFNGWNLLGNPFTCKVYVTADETGTAFYRMNADGDGLEVATGSISPLEGFFVQTPQTTTTITISREEPAKRGQLNINLTRNVSRGMKTCDNAIIVFGEGHNLGKFSFREGSSKIYMPYEGQDCAAVFSTGLGEIPVNFKAEKNGTYTLNFNAVEVKFTYLHLIDNLTGADVDLLQQPEYTFDARTNDYASRFKVMFVSKGEDAAVDNETFAFNSNGNWIIANEGRATLQVIDINGRILSSEQINGCAETRINAAAGVYVIRLVNGENVRTQKVIVK